jgi:DNA or RNA helicases of superfamily II
MDNILKFINKYQVDAINVINKYISSNSKKNCLIKLPTGTGKTGIMAIVSNTFENNVLIITPNATLPEQVAKEIENDFWNNIGYQPKKVKKVNIIEESKTDLFKINEEKVIYIITIQELLQIYSNNYRLFTKLKNEIGLILYDEGHREPAKKWSLVNRDLNKKMILFTATPYRNDDYLFEIDNKYIYKYTMKQAIENNEVKSPIFKIIPKDILKADVTTSKFISDIAENKSTKILVRCKNHKKISNIAGYLSKNYTVLGCHSKFSNKDNLFDSGKRIISYNDDFKIIVHSDMLIEGINIPQLNVLIFIDCFKNFKSIIQQIGRILRKYDDDKAIVYLPEDDFEEICKQWELYILAEQNEKEYLYIDGKFRKKYDIDNDLDFYKEINYKKQASVYFSEQSVLDELINEIKADIAHLENLENIDESFYEEGKLWTLCYIKREPSKILLSKYWIDSSLEYISLVEVEYNNTYYYFYYNSRRYALPKISQELNSVNIEQLYNLIPDNTEIRAVKYTNTNLYKVGAQTKLINGFTLNGVPSNLTEKLSICKNALGRFEDNDGNYINRYVGTVTSKISERVKEDCGYLAYVTWCNNIVAQMNTSLKSKYFNRFAKISKEPSSCATSIMIDFSTLDIYKDNEKCDFDSQFCLVDNNVFNFELGEETITGILKKGNDNKLFILTYGLEDYIIKTDEEIYNLNEYIEKRRFMVYYGDEQISYLNGYYFTPNIQTRYNNINDFELWDSITTIKELKKCCNEKLGEHPSNAFNGQYSWPEDSIFGVLINEIDNNHKNINYLVCDDLGCEIADFIALNTTEKKVYFIHCKDKKSNISASAFQDVCGQAIKNVEYILKSNPESQEFIKEHYSRWKEKWKLSYDKNQYLADRHIKGDVKLFLKEYKKIMQNPNSSKEVWLVTNGLSKNQLKKELLKKKPQEQISQLLYILNLTQDNLSQVGALLRIFCKE